MRKLLIICLLLFLPVAGITAETGQGDLPSMIQKKVASTINVRQETQKKEDEWATEKAKLKSRYRSLRTDLKYLTQVRERTEMMLHAKKEEIVDIERMIKESARIREELQSYLETVVSQLEEWIKNDLTFLPKERKDRIVSIKEMLARQDTPLAEKYRRVMEALQIETEYGRTVEVYQKTIELEGKPRLVDILRVGRLSLFCRTPDGKLAGSFDQRNQKWVVLPSKYRREINKAADIAGRRRTIELTRLPIGRITVQ
ncbi:MAG: hypothetical protein B1H13_02530 [Desulfobacteraceae bacterium 4484_190.3]|nr:MAG: hypothetical protein B1H13_02530 [Desulfobacteraceae bacterium 4484_190.3]